MESVSDNKTYVTLEGNEPLTNYILHLADNVLILGHRLSEWCGHGPVLEQDIAITNISLDLVGQARMYYQYAANLKGEGFTEDTWAYLRDAWDYRNVLLVEQPNGDWGQTIVRQFFFDAWHYFFLDGMRNSQDEQLRAIAEKSLKEVTYHLRYSSEWMIRLGDGTEESHARMQRAVDLLWPFTGELLNPNSLDREMTEAGIAPDLEKIDAAWQSKVTDILQQATLEQPAVEWMQSGGKEGRHSEHLGFILADLQFMQRTYPGMEW